jgi:hypothetical protein
MSCTLLEKSDVAAVRFADQIELLAKHSRQKPESL